MELKTELLTKEAGRADILQKRSHAKKDELESVKRALESRKATVNANSQEKGRLEV